MFLADANGSNLGEPVISDVPEASSSVQATPTVSVEQPISVSDDVTTTPNWSLIVLIFIIVVALGAIGTLFFRNRKKKEVK